MTVNGFAQLGLYVLALLWVTKPLGLYMAKVFSGEKTFLKAIVEPVERLVYRVCRVDADKEQHWTEYTAAMPILFLTGFFAVYHFESRGNPMLNQFAINQSPVAIKGFQQSGGNMEGKEVRLGIMNSALFATVTTDTSCGAINSWHDSFTPLGGMVPLVNIMLGEIIFGGVGAGMYGMLVMIVLTVFIAGLMVGRTPEYLGKKIESKDVKLAMLYVLVFALSILMFSAWAGVARNGVSQINNGGPHGLSEIVYAFTSATGNNGSAFAGLNGNTVWYNTTMGLAMLIGRFLRIIPMMGIKTVMIAGDNPLTAAAIAREAGVDDFLAEAKPRDKMDLIRREQGQGKRVAMTGDGTNDAPAVALALESAFMNLSKHIIPAVAMTVVLTILLGLVYPFVITGLAQIFFRSKARGSLIQENGQVMGSRLIGQPFSGPRYFHSRPSAAGWGYDATASGGTNFGPTSRQLIDGNIKTAATALHSENPGGLIPVDLVTSSASGLDPDISPAAAEFQVARVADARGMNEGAVRQLVQNHITGRQFGVLGEARVNVLELNLALDAAAHGLRGDHPRR